MDRLHSHSHCQPVYPDPLCLEPRAAWRSMHQLTRFLFLDRIDQYAHHPHGLIPATAHSLQIASHQYEESRLGYLIYGRSIVRAFSTPMLGLSAASADLRHLGTSTCIASVIRMISLLKTDAEDFTCKPMSRKSKSYLLLLNQSNRLRLSDISRTLVLHRSQLRCNKRLPPIPDHPIPHSLRQKAKPIETPQSLFKQNL